MIVYCCSDLLFATKVRASAEALGIASRPARDGVMLRDRLERIDDGRGAGPVTGVVVDLTLGDPAIELVRLAVSHPASPRVVAFGPHVDEAALAAAAEAGAHAVMPRSRFSATLPAILESLR